jgi:hypothetical protein
MPEKAAFSVIFVSIFRLVSNFSKTGNLPTKRLFDLVVGDPSCQALDLRNGTDESPTLAGTVAAAWRGRDPKLMLGNFLR